MATKSAFTGWICDECGSKFEWDPSGSYDDIEQHKKQQHPDISEWDDLCINRVGNVVLRKKLPVEKRKNCFPKTQRSYCHFCEGVTDWAIDHAFVRFHGICPVLVRQECGMEVPDFAFARYLDEGRVIIPV